MCAQKLFLDLLHFRETLPLSSWPYIAVVDGAKACLAASVWPGRTMDGRLLSDDGHRPKQPFFAVRVARRAEKSFTPADLVIRMDSYSCFLVKCEAIGKNCDWQSIENIFMYSVKVDATYIFSQCRMLEEVPQYNILNMVKFMMPKLVIKNIHAALFLKQY